MGRRAEQMAERYLNAKGYVTLQRRYRCRRGEIDLILREGEWLVFCEVKYRSSLAMGRPAETVDLRKQQKLKQTARFYLLMSGTEDVNCRFDVVEIYPVSDEGKIRYRAHHYLDAFE